MVAPIILSISIFVICAVIIFRESCEIVIYPVSKLLIFHPHLKEVAIEYNHTHTPTASDQEKTECALCAQLFISISPVLRGTK